MNKNHFICYNERKKQVDEDMEQLLQWMEIIEDSRQQAKVRHSLKDIIAIVLFATLANADTWEEIEDFAKGHEEYLRQYLELKNGIPSHDTIQRVMGMVRTEHLGQLQLKWQEMLNSNEGELIKKIICIDGKTMCSNKRKDVKPNHIVSAWSREDGYCLGQKTVNQKSNEITAIPQVLDAIEIKGQVVTIDAMGTQTEIAAKIKSRRADYVLSLKGNQKSLYEDVKLYFSDKEVCRKIKEQGNYVRTTEKARSQLEIREYYQTEDIKWLSQKKNWKGITSIGMEEKTIYRDGAELKEYRYYISSLKADIELFKRAVRGHWAIESMHWQLDVTFKEDANHTLDKIAAQNQNVIRKWCISILQLLEINGKKMSMARKRFNISMNPMKYLEEILSF